MSAVVQEETEQALRVYRALDALIEDGRDASIEGVQAKTGLTRDKVLRAYRVIHRVINEVDGNEGGTPRPPSRTSRRPRRRIHLLRRRSGA